MEEEMNSKWMLFRILVMIILTLLLLILVPLSVRL